MFDSIIERRGSSCYKWDWDERITGRQNLLPFWLADMDFMAPPAVLAALHKRVEHGVFGYTAKPDSLIEALTEWFQRHHGWSIPSDIILEIPGAVPFIHIFIQCFTQPGEPVVIQEPVYYPFRQALEKNGRQVAVNPLIQDSYGSWTMDFLGLEQILDETGAKYIILCSPHNPVSRVWSRDELMKLAKLCKARNVTVLSDEIHADLTQDGFTHIPWLTLPADSLPQSMTILSSNKTFNLPGLSTAWVVVPDVDLRHKIRKFLECLGMGMINTTTLAYTAAEAAWREGDAWLDALLNYIGANARYLRDFISTRFPQSTVAPFEGTYLAWLDFRNLEMKDQDLWEKLLENGVWLSQGTQFGIGGRGHLRINLATPATLLERGLEMMARALGR